MVGLSLGWLILACGPAEQAMLDPYTRSLSAYDAGRAALDRGESQAAVIALEAAVKADPRSPELWLWLGRAQAAAGSPGDAVQAAGQALALHPGWGVALYNRACWRVRADQLELAVVDLEAALSTGEVGPLQAAVDPDLDPLRAHPTLSARVPGRGLPVMVEGSPESVFWDSDWTLTLLVSSPLEASVVVNWEGPAPPGLTLRRVVEDVSYEGQEVRRSISWTWRVGTAHEGEVGPLRVRSAGLEGLTDPIEVRFLTPPDAPVVSTSEPELSLVSELFGHLVEAEPVREGDLVRVRVSTGDRVSWEPRPDRVVRTELREKGQVLWTGWEAHAPSGTGLTVARGNSVIFQGPLP